MTTTPRSQFATTLHTYRISWELTTRANFMLSGVLVVKAPGPAHAIAKTRERLGFRYGLPEASIDCAYCDELTPHR